MGQCDQAGPAASAALFVAGTAASASGIESFRTVDIQAKVVPSATLAHLWIAFAAASKTDGSWLFARLAPASPGFAPKDETTRWRVTVDVQDFAHDFGDWREDHRLVFVGLRQGRDDAVVVSFGSADEGAALRHALGRAEQSALGAAIRTGNRLGMFQAFAGGRYLTPAKPGRLIDLSTGEDIGLVRLCKVGEPWPMRSAAVDIRGAFFGVRKRDPERIR